eukprot:6187038-Pleurochrysis_carterae.AAC.1
MRAKKYDNFDFAVARSVLFLSRSRSAAPSTYLLAVFNLHFKVTQCGSCYSLTYLVLGQEANNDEIIPYLFGGAANIDTTNEASQ